MNKGFWAGDAIASGLEIAGMNIRRAAQDEHTANVMAQKNARIEKLEKDVDKWVSICAGNYAEKYALRAALAQLDPQHRLLQNQLLLEDLRDQAARVFAIGQNWDDVSSYGRRIGEAAKR